MSWTMQQLQIKKLTALLGLLKDSGQLSPHYKLLITNALKEIGRE